MAEPPDLDTLARRYVELWQDQWTALATDPDAARTMMRLAELFAAPAATAGTAFGAPEPDREPAAPRTASAQPSSGDGDGRLDELARRVAALEKRLAGLEVAAPRRSGTGTRRRRS